MDCLDSWRYLSQWLDDKSKFFLMITSHKMMKLELYFNEIHSFRAILCSSFYHYFTNLKVDDTITLINKSLYNGSMITLPKKIQRMKFSNHFNKRIKVRMIPPTVTHLSFGTKFNYPIESDIIPSSVVDLRFGNVYHQDISNCLSSSLKYLKMGNAKTTYFPESLEHLTYYKDLDIKIPSSVKYLCVNMLKENMVPGSKIWN